MTARMAVGAGLGALVGTSLGRAGFGWVLDVDGIWLVVLVIACGLLGSGVGLAAALERRQEGASERVAPARARTVSAALVGVLIGAWIGRAAFKWILDVEGTLLAVLMIGCAAIGGVLFALAEREQAQAPARPSPGPSAE